MIAQLILWSIRNRFLVLVSTLLLLVGGLWAVRTTPVDALPDLSDVQVIVRTTYPGQAPELVEAQVTYPLTSALLATPGARAVRGYSFFGDSFIYVLFEDNVDLYWARSRVLETLAQVQDRLPQGSAVSLGPDATGVGWIYEYALLDRTGRHDLAQLRSLQDWFLRFELKAIPDVAEVASLGGMVKQYQVVVHPERMRTVGLTYSDVMDALRRANQATGGSVIELAETEYMIRSTAYLSSVADIGSIVVRNQATGGVVRLSDIATVQVGPEMRRGIAELNGEGEVVGGIVVLRSGKNARAALEAIEARIESLRESLPPGVEIVTTYDRSGLIDRAIDNLTHKLVEEFIVVAIACGLFLLHARSALVAVITLPLGVLASFLIMRAQGLNANIMSLGGIAIAVGAMVDAAVVMIENAHKHLEHWRTEHDSADPTGEERWRVIGSAAVEVGPALFLSLLIITLSFLPVFTLEAQEGRLFAPLAFTKSYAMAASAILAVTLTPVLMGYLIRGHIRAETENPINRAIMRAYRPVLDTVIRRPGMTLAVAGIATVLSLLPAMRLGAEFMPPLDEGDILYMPTALPGLSIGKASQLLQQTDRMIRTVPEVETVFGKAGRADTATDPAPIEMFETTIRLKPRHQWREGMTMDKIIAELDAAVRVPGLSNVWVPPIRNRIDMLATGIKSPVGIKITGPDLHRLNDVAKAIEVAVLPVPGVTSAIAERTTGGRYIDVEIDRLAAGRYGVTVEEVQSVISSAIGGMAVSEIIEGRARYTLALRLPRETRDSITELAQVPILRPDGGVVLLGDVAQLRVTEGPAMVRSENGRLATWVYVDVRGRDLRSVVTDMQRVVAEQVNLPAGYALSWSGQFEYLERATERLQLVVPLTLLIILVLLYLTFRRLDEALLLMASLPAALIGGIWLILALGHAVSVASAVGFIALAGVAAEFAVVMLLYLRNAWDARVREGRVTEDDLRDAIREGAVLRVRPKAMTVAVILAGLVPILWSGGTGSEVMQRIAAPMVGGMISAPLLSMLVIPAAFLLMRRRDLRRTSPSPDGAHPPSSQK